MVSSDLTDVCHIVPSGRVWRCDDILARSHIPVEAIAQDARGYLWIGSQSGPIRFDGLYWSYLPSLGTLHGAYVSAFVAVAGDGLWGSSNGSGLFLLHVGEVMPELACRVTPHRGLPSPVVRALCLDHGDLLWAATENGLAAVEGDRVVRCLTVADGLPSNHLSSVCCDQYGHVWAGTNRGLARIIDGAVQEDSSASTCLQAGSVRRLYCDQWGRIWAGLHDGAVLRCDEAGNMWKSVLHCDSSVSALRCDAGGRMWIGTETGLLVLEDDVVQDMFTMRDGLPSNGIRALYEDAQGRLWVGTTSGLAVINNAANPVHSFQGIDRAQDQPVYAFATDSEGRLWIGGEHVLALVDLETTRPAAMPPVPKMLLDTTIWAMHCDHAGQMWAGTDHQGLLCLDLRTGDVVARYVPGYRAYCLLALDTGTLWVGLGAQGLIGIDMATRTVVHELMREADFPYGQVRALCVDKNGTLWAGTWLGWLVGVDPARGIVETTVRLSDDETPRITGLALDQAGLLWATTSIGLAEVDVARGAVRRWVGAADGLPSTCLYGCCADHLGYLWLASQRGVARYAPWDGHCVTLGRTLGLPNEDCNIGALFPDGHDRIWVGTMGGTGAIDARLLQADAPECQVHLTGFTAMGREQEITPDLEIDDSQYDLTFDYGTVTYSAAEQVLYRVQLKGLEDDWSAPTRRRSVRYTMLRPGSYTFRVSARAWGGTWSTPLEIPFRVVQDRKARAIEQALERERIEKQTHQAAAERLRELNRQLEEADRLKSSLIAQVQEQAATYEYLSRHDGLTGLLNRRAFDAQLYAEIARARLEGHPLSIVLSDLDHFKWINDTFSHQVGDQVLRAVADLFLRECRSGDSVGRYGGEEIACILPGATEAEAVAMSERLRHTIERFDWPSISSGLRVTISHGVVSIDGTSDIDVLVGRADRCLYAAKRAGRNRTESWSANRNAQEQSA